MCRRLGPQRFRTRRNFMEDNSGNNNNNNNNNASGKMQQQQQLEIIPNETETRRTSLSSATESPAIPAVKVTDDQETVTSQSASCDHVEASSAADDVTTSSSSSSRDESHRPNPAPQQQQQQQQQPRPSKAERILGLTSRDFESAATEARRRRDGPRAPPPSDLDLRPPGSAGGSPRSTRRQGPDPSTASPSSPLDPAAAGHRKQCPQKKSSKTGGGLQPPVDHRARGFAPATGSSASHNDLKVVGNGSEADSDVDLSSVADDGSSTSSGANFAPKKSSEHRGRDRFKKILKPGTRSKSAGASRERAPAYALFLRHQKPPTIIRSTDDVMRNSAENTESDEETTDGGSGTSGKLPGGTKQKKDRFSFFRRGAEGHSGPAYSNALLPSAETLQGWTRSFEKLLTDKYGVKLFREFLRREFSDENVEFWIECEKYRHLTSEKQRIAESKKIFREFVAVQAPNEINLDSKTRETTEANLCRAEPRLFEAAQKRIEALMEKDSFPRFLQSDVFQRLLQQRQTADNSLRVT